MNRAMYKKESDPFQVLMLKDCDWGRGYSYVGKQVGNNCTEGLIQQCNCCKAPTLIRDVQKWRSTGAGLICHICSGVKPGNIVADDNYEILKVIDKNQVLLPKRLKEAKSNFEKEFYRKMDSDIQWITKELKIDNNNPWLYIHRAGLLAKKNYANKNYEQVWKSDLEKAKNINPKNPMIFAWYCSLLYSCLSFHCKR